MLGAVSSYAQEEQLSIRCLDRVGGRSLSRGRAQRGRNHRSQSHRFNGARSRSDTPCRQGASDAEDDVACIDDHAVGFMCSIMDDAVDVFTDEVLQEVDAESKIAPGALQFPSEAQLVLNVDDPALMELDEEEETDASMITGLGQPIQPVPVLDMTFNSGMKSEYEKETDDTDDGDDYEEVLSLASEDSIDAEENDEEIETLAYVNMAVQLAKKAVFKGCEEVSANDAIEEEIAKAQTEEQETGKDVQVDLERAKMFAREALRNALLGGEEEDSEDEPHPEVDLRIAKAKAIQALKVALLESPSSGEQGAERSVLKEKIRETLLTSALNGKLAQCLADRARAKQEQQIEELKAKAHGALAERKVEKKVDEVRAIVQQAFLTAASNGKLEQIVAAECDKEKHLEELRSEARAAFISAASNGRLHGILAGFAKVEKSQEITAKCESPTERKAPKGVLELGAEARQAFLAAASNGKLEQIITKCAKSEEQRQLDELKATAREALMLGAQTGALSKSLAELGTENGMDKLKAEARHMFMAAVSNGKLEQFLSERAAEAKKGQKEPLAERGMENKVDELRAEARQTLTAAVANGKLEQFFAERAEAKKAQQIGELKAKVRQTLLTSASNGKFDEYLAELAEAKKTQQKEELKVKATQAMITSASTGELHQYLAERGEAKKIEALKATVRQTLSTSVCNGRFGQQLAEAMKRQQTAEVEEASHLEAVLAKVRQTMMSAASNGKFQQYLAERAQEKKELQMEECRAKVRDTFARGLQSGAVQNYLAESSKGPANSDADLKSRARQVLVKAAFDGRLLLTLNQAAPKQAMGQFTYSEDESDVAGGSTDRINEWGKPSAAVLEKASGAGAVEQVVKPLEMKEDDEQVVKPLEMKEELLETEASMTMPTTSTPKEESEVSYKPPLTPSRSKRRIIGGLVRSPTSEELPLASPSMSLQPEALHSSRKKRGKDRTEQTKASETVFVTMSGDEESTSINDRESSLTRGYESLGAKFYSMSSNDFATDFPAKQGSARKDWSQQATSHAQFLGAPAFDRPSSKASTRLRSASSSAPLSAMAMDLGPSSGSPPQNLVPWTAFRDLKPLAMSPKMRVSQSLGSLGSSRSQKMKGGSLLPALPSEKSAHSIAWSMGISKKASKLTSTSLRGSASASVF